MRLRALVFGAAALVVFVGVAAAATSTSTATSTSVVAQQSGEDEPMRVGGSIKPPKKIKHVDPVYPPEAREAGIQGVVIVEAVIDKEGKVARAKVVRSVPELDQAALDAVLQWEFEPTSLDGKPVSVIMTVTVNFVLAK